MMPYKLITSSLVIQTVAWLWFASSANGELSIPRQLHCLSDVVYRNQDLKLEKYVVDEYVDVPNDRSSVKLVNWDKSSTNIYYHQINPPAGPRERKFIVYDVGNGTCQFYQPMEWPLKMIRKIAMQLVPINKLNREICDLILGPSVLLLAVESSLGDFKFTRRSFTPDRLTRVDIYERVEDTNSDLVMKDQSLVVTVQVGADHTIQGSQLAGKTLADVPASKRDYVSLRVCLVSTKRVSRRALGEEFKCSDDEIELQIQYYIVTEMLQGSLVGRELDETKGFDYSLDPFMQTVGVGCWKDVSYMGQKRFNAPSEKFSAEFITSTGSSSVSYVTFDGARNLLRLDQDGRKSIYNLASSKSYHYGEFVAQTNPSEPRNKQKSCIVMDIGKDSSSIRPHNMLIEQILGIGSGTVASAIHLGSKVVDHVPYEVYEREIFNSFPLLIRSRGHGQFSPDTRYFMTYYVNKLKYQQDLDLGDSAGADNSLLLPKFMELHALAKDKQKQLINWLEFTQFSWSLEVEPKNDPDGLGNMFYIEECAQLRTSQVELQFGIQQYTKSAQVLPARMEDSFRQQKRMISENIQGRVADLLGLSDLNVAQFDLLFLPNSVDFLVRARLAKLQDSVTDDTKLGYVSFFDFEPKYKSSFISLSLDRHSLDDCKLDSLMERQKNSLLFCPSITACALIKSNAIQGAREDIQKDAYKFARKGDEVVCELHNFIYAPADADEGAPLLDVVQQSLFELENRRFQVDFDHYDPANKEPQVEHARFIGFSHDARASSLDETGVREARAGLVGLRYATKAEGPPSMHNNNIDLDVSDLRRRLGRRGDPFKHCQLACQLDDFCQSFSYCHRSPNEPLQAGDCILSSMRLFKSRVEYLAKRMREILELDTRGTSDYDQGVQVAVGHQTFGFERRQECSIHPKDVAAAYQIGASLRLKTKKLAKENSETAVGTLDECAAYAHDRYLMAPESRTNFTYCPLSGSCLPEGQGDLVGQRVGQEQQCYVYQRTHSQFFQLKHHSHLALTSLAGQVGTSEITSTMRGLTREQCARHCTMRSNQCMSFDHCLVAGGEQSPAPSDTNCLLYSVRSPLFGPPNRRVGLLPQEPRIYPENEKVNRALIVGSLACDHYAMRPVYADVRVPLLMQLERQRLEGEGAAQREDEDKLEELERQLDKEKEITGDGSMGRRADASDVSGHTGRQVIFFLAGFLFTGLVILYGQQAATYARDQWPAIVARRTRRNQETRISEVKLANEILDEIHHT